MIKTGNFEQVEVSSAQQLRKWLEHHHQQTERVWLVTFKKHVPEKYVSTSEVLDELLCFGWIDGIRRKLDPDRTMQLISPRKAQHWAKSYKDRAARLEKEQKMQPAGRKAMEESKRNGLWHFMEDVDALIKPADLQKALEDNPPALEEFNAFPPATQRFILRWIKLAKTKTTRAKRVEKTASLAQKGEKIPGS